MKEEQRLDALEAAQHFVDQAFPMCDAALLAGSIVRGEATATSDLDLVIVTKEVTAPYRESLYASGWPAEVFVHTPTSYREFFASDIQRRRPSLPRMCVEGIILRDHQGAAQRLKQEARDLLEQGPPSLSKEEITQLRYFLTDILDDFIGSVRLGESFFIASELADRATELMLSYRGQWIGKGKWALRALHAFDPKLAQQLVGALETFYHQGKKDGLITFAQEALNLVGGRLFEGYSSR